MARRDGRDTSRWTLVFICPDDLPKASSGGSVHVAFRTPDERGLASDGKDAGVRQVEHTKFSLACRTHAPPSSSTKDMGHAPQRGHFRRYDSSSATI